MLGSRALWILVLCLSPINMAFGQAPAGQSPSFTIVATGSVSTAPDMATVSLGVEHRAPTAAGAMELLKADLAKVFAALSGFGVEDRDIQTTGLRLVPLRTHTSSGKVRDEGFAASSDITVRVRDLEGLGALLDGIVQEGANLFRGLSYGLSDPAPLEDAARQAAVVEAIRRAALYAEAAEVPKGVLLSISEARVSAQPSPMMRFQVAEAASSPVPTASGEITVTATITAIFGSNP